MYLFQVFLQKKRIMLLKTSHTGQVHNTFDTKN